VPCNELGRRPVCCNEPACSAVEEGVARGSFIFLSTRGPYTVDTMWSTSGTTAGGMTGAVTTDGPCNPVAGADELQAPPVAAAGPPQEPPPTRAASHGDSLVLAPAGIAGELISAAAVAAVAAPGEGNGREGRNVLAFAFQRGTGAGAAAAECDGGTGGGTRDGTGGGTSGGADGGTDGGSAE